MWVSLELQSTWWVNLQNTFINTDFFWRSVLAKPNEGMLPCLFPGNKRLDVQYAKHPYIFLTWGAEGTQCLWSDSKRIQEHISYAASLSAGEVTDNHAGCWSQAACLPSPTFLPAKHCQGRRAVPPKAESVSQQNKADKALPRLMVDINHKAWMTLHLLGRITEVATS